MEYTKELVQFCSDLSFQNMPDEVKHKTKLCVLDYVANIYGSLELERRARWSSSYRSLGGPRGGDRARLRIQNRPPERGLHQRHHGRGYRGAGRASLRREPPGLRGDPGRARRGRSMGLGR